MRKYYRLKIMRDLISTLLVMCILLVGCSRSETGTDRSPETSTKTDSLGEYGELSYSYLIQIAESYPERIAGTEQEANTAGYIQEQLLQMGYEASAIELEEVKLDNFKKREDSCNVILTVPGKKEETILIGAHYDCVETTGTDDNGSGVALLLESASRIKEIETEYTIQYVFFGAEEIGCMGSADFVLRRSPDELQNIILMVNVDSIAAGDYCYVYGGLSQEDGTVIQTEAVERAYELAGQLELDIRLNPGLNTEYPSPTTIPGCSDYYQFAIAGIPYLYFEATNWEIGEKDGYTQCEILGEVMHSKNDDPDVIETTYPGRIRDHLQQYSQLLDYIIEFW